MVVLPVRKTLIQRHMNQGDCKHLSRFFTKTNCQADSIYGEWTRATCSPRAPSAGHAHGSQCFLCILYWLLPDRKMYYNNSQPPSLHTTPETEPSSRGFMWKENALPEELDIKLNNICTGKKKTIPTRLMTPWLPLLTRRFRRLILKQLKTRNLIHIINQNNYLSSFFSEYICTPSYYTKHKSLTLRICEIRPPYN